MLDFDSALDAILNTALPSAQERVPLSAALGRFLCRPLIATRPIPEFDYSAMDGYALCTRDLNTEHPVLPIKGVSAAGSPLGKLEPGTTMRIFTGAPIPESADSVAMQENVESEAGVARFTKPPRPGDNVRRRGEDLETGEQALAAGVELNAFHLGLAAALDYAELVVAKKPRVGVLCTGDELRPPGSAARPGSIPNSNGVALTAMIQSAGGVPQLLPTTSDALQATRTSIAEGLERSDVLVTVGGVSVGDRDIVREALESLGVETVFHKVAIKPGKPLYFGTFGDKRILGLPGNPASAQITFALFGLPLLRALQGKADPRPARVQARLTRPIEQKPGRRGFYRAKLEGELVTPLDNQASGATTAMAWADALVILAETVGHRNAGDVVEAIPFSEL